MDFLLSVFAILLFNALYLLEQALGFWDEISEERRLRRKADDELWFALVVRLFFLSMNLAGLWLCLSRYCSRLP
jgi:hypothetical protein